MRPVPYRTRSGLQIGLFYFPTSHTRMSRDEERLQEALLRKPFDRPFPVSSRLEFVWALAVCVAIVSACALLVDLFTRIAGHA